MTWASAGSRAGRSATSSASRSSSSVAVIGSIGRARAMSASQDDGGSAGASAAKRSATAVARTGPAVVVGSFTFDASRIIPVLEEANTATTPSSTAWRAQP